MDRTKWIHIRVTEAEHSAWQALAQAHKQTVSDLIRSRIGECQPVGRSPKRRQRLARQTDPALLRELARIGNNLNQVARWANTYKSASESVAVCTHLLAIERTLRQLYDLQLAPIDFADDQSVDQGVLNCRAKSACEAAHVH